MTRRVTKEAALRFAKKDNRKVLWTDERGSWHAATNLLNTPFWAKEVIEVVPATVNERELYEAGKYKD